MSPEPSHSTGENVVHTQMFVLNGAGLLTFFKCPFGSETVNLAGSIHFLPDQNTLDKPTRHATFFTKLCLGALSGKNQRSAKIKIKQRAHKRVLACRGRGREIKPGPPPWGRSTDKFSACKRRWLGGHPCCPPRGGLQPCRSK